MQLKSLMVHLVSQEVVVLIRVVVVVETEVVFETSLKLTATERTSKN